VAELVRAIGGGIAVTVEIALLAALGSLLLGVLVTALRICPVPALRWPATAYVVGFRSIPLAVVCFLAAFGLPAVGLPLLGSGLSYPRLFVLALVVYTGAFVSDAIIAGLDTVPRGHAEQAHVLGATAGQRARYVIVPQTWRPAVVKVGRVLITLIKNSALAGSFGVVGDLSQTVDGLAGAYPGSIIATLVGVAAAYLIMTMPLTMMLDRVERGLGGAEAGSARPEPARTGRAANLMVTAALIVLAYVCVYRPLARAGQFSARLWAPMTDPGDPTFALFWGRIGAGLQSTLGAAALTIIASLLGGTALVMLQVVLDDRRRALGVAVRLSMNVLRGLPVVITILIVSRGLPALGMPLADPLWYLVVGLTLHNLVAVAEIIRSGLHALPESHREAAYLMGAGPVRTARTILLPQALPIVLPALTSRLIVVLMDTSLAFVVGYEELLAVARQANSELQAPIQVYLTVALIYLALNVVLAAFIRRPSRLA